MGLKKGLFAGIKDAKPRVDANYLKEGHYYLVINKVKADETRKGEAYVVIELTVLHILDGSGHTLGESVSHLLMQKHDSFLGNIKAFMENALGLDDSEYTDDELESAAIDMCDEEKNPLEWTCVECENREIILQKTGKPFTLINYKREVPITEVVNVTDERILEKVFPEGLLEKLIDLEPEATA